MHEIGHLFAILLAQMGLVGNAGPVPVLTGMEKSQIFTYFFIMLGPMKLLGPFAKLSAEMDQAAARKLAFKGFIIASLAGIAAAFIGERLLEKWNVSLAALLLAAGLILLLVALRTVLAPYSPPGGPEDAPNPARQHPSPSVSPLAFPHILTPFGIAAMILLLAAASDDSRRFEIVGVFLEVMVLNLVFMWLARPILKHAAGVLRLLGGVLGVLQIALALQMFVAAGRLLVMQHG